MPDNEDKNARMNLVVSESDSENSIDENCITNQVNNHSAEEIDESNSDGWGPVVGNFATFSLPVNLGIPENIAREVRQKNELAFYKLFLSDEVINMMVLQTDLYANQQIILGVTNESITKNSRLNAWVDTNANEIHMFIALVMWMGLDRKPSLKDYWRKNPLYVNNISKHMSRNRFELLLRMFYLANNEECPPNDCLHKIQSLIDILNSKFQRAMIPEENICIDETMIPFRGKLSFRQYLKGKRHKFGMKLFKICLAHGFTYRVKIYCGKEHVVGQPVAERIVLEMINPLLDNGRTLFVDNWYTSVDLAEKLQMRSTHLVGTLRKNRKKLPKSVINAKLKKGDIVARQNNKIVVMKWFDKRDVLILSTNHTDDMQDVYHREGPRRKPSAILDYNNAKSFVDTSDQMTAYSNALRKSMKWYRKIAIELTTGTSVVNAWVLFNKINNKKTSITKFKENLCVQLFETYGTVETPAENHFQHKLIEKKENGVPKRGRCKICYKKNSREHGRDYAAKNTKRITLCCKGCETAPFMCTSCFFEKHLCKAKK